MRWKSLFGGVALLLAVTGGCKQRCFLTEGDFYNVQTSMTSELELNPNGTTEPLIPLTAAPSTILDPERKVRYISLAEAISIALEQGTTGNVSLPSAADNPLTPGLTPIYAENLVTSFQGQVNQAIALDSIRVLALDPALVGSNIDLSLSKFDAVWTTSATWTTTDQPVATALQAFQTGSTGLSAINSQDATVNTALLKPLPTGGVTGLTFTVPYTNTNLPARVNPSYRPQLQFQFEQPLMQGFGVEINQLRNSHPGSILTPNNLYAPPQAEGILITRIRFDIQRAEFERQVHNMLYNVEAAYWQLYGSYWSLYAQEAGLRAAYESWKINKAKYEAGRGTIADFAQTRGQYELFRFQRLTALSQVLEGERVLRGMLGMPVEDGCRLVPCDAPTLAPYHPDWCSALQDALTLRPELMLLRDDLKRSQMNLIAAKNSLLPDLRFTATYDINSIGTRLDGSSSDSSDALRNLASNRFNDWALGLRLQIPLGYRQSHANVRIARLQLARTYEGIKEQELKAARSLEAQYRNIQTFYEKIIAARAQREAFAEQLRARYQRYLVGTDTLDILLEAQRFWSTALQTEYQEIALYNVALAAFEYCKGTIMQHDNVAISEGPLPGCVQARAVEHQRERTKALVIRERAVPCNGKNGCSPEKDLPGGASLPSDESLPAAWNLMPPLKDPKMLPPKEKLPMIDPKTIAPVEAKPEEVFPITPPSQGANEMPKTLPPVPATKSGATLKKTTTVFGSLRPTETPADDVPKTPALPREPLPIVPVSSKP